MTQYIIRLDDLSKFSNKDRWDAIIKTCRDNKVKCLIGVIPACSDSKLMHGKVMNESEFWSLVRSYKDMDLAMHGFDHSLFGGKTYDTQFKMMAGAMKIFASHRIIPDCFIAPKHSYDKNTCMAMHNLGISFLSDGVGLFPWRRMDYDIIQVPQIVWKPRKMLYGTITFCLHPDTMSDTELFKLLEFIYHNKNDIISIYDVILTPLEYINVIFEPLYTLLYIKKFRFKLKLPKFMKR